MADLLQEKRLREERGEIGKRIMEMSDKCIARLESHDALTGDFSPDEQRVWDRLNSQYDGMTAEIDKLVKDTRSGSTMPALPGRDDIPFNPNRIDVDDDDTGGRAQLLGKLDAPKYRFLGTNGREYRSISGKERFADLCTSTGAKATDYDDAELLGRAMRSYITGDLNHRDEKELRLSSVIGQQGGFLLPTMLSATIIDLARNKSSVMSSGVQTIAMDGPDLTIARVLSDPTPEFVGEMGRLPSSDMTFGGYKLIARKMGVIVYMPTELDEDAVGLSNTLASSIGEAIALAIDAAVLSGVGGGPSITGIRNWSGVTLTAIGGSLDYDDMLDALTPIELANGAATGWIANPTQAAVLRKMKDGNGQYLNSHPDISPLKRLISNQQTAGEITFGDFSQVLIGVRRQLKLEVFRNGSVDSTAGGADAVNLIQQDAIAVRATLRMDSLLLRPGHFNVLTGIS